MKKNLYSFVCVCSLIIILLCACGKQQYQGNPIVLPAREDIVSIGVSDGERYAVSPNTEVEATEFMNEFFSILMDMDITDKQSVTDVPTDKDYITITLNCIDNKNTTLFYYKDKGVEYVEQPYQGIYTPAPALGYYLTEMLDLAENTPVTVTFQATVIEANANSILVRSIDDSPELDLANQFSIPNEEQLELQNGDLLEITYNGEILESFPAQLGEVYNIVLIGRTEADERYPNE